MKLPNKIPEIDQNLVFEYKSVYYLQKIIKYDEGSSESCVIGVWYSPDGDIDKALQDIIKQEKEFCERNTVKPHTFTIRKIQAVISSEELWSRSEHYGNALKKNTLKCTNCDGNINYGDEVVVKKYEDGDKYFCCNDCLAEYEDATKYSPDDNEYDKLFIENSW